MPINEIIICGGPRTGTTALCRMFNACHNFFIFNELGCYVTPPDDFKRMLPDRMLNPDWSNMISSRGIDIFKMAEQAGDKPWTIPKLVSETYGIENTGDKLPLASNPDDVKCILSYSPNTKFLFTIRDYRAVIASSLRYHKEGKSGPWIFPTIQQAAYMWYKCTLNTVHSMSLLKSDRFLCIRYEYTCNNLQRVLGNISTLFNTEIVTNRSINDIYVPTNVDSWRKELNQNALTMVPKNVVQLGLALGYE